MTDDEQEAGSIVYNTARIVRLTSGNFALFHPFRNGQGMPIAIIGSIEEVHKHIPSYDECVEYCRGFEMAELEQRKPSKAELKRGEELLLSLGLVKPKPQIDRRF